LLVIENAQEHSHGCESVVEAVRVLLAPLTVSKSKKKSQNRNYQGFPYLFLVLIEGFGPGSGSIPLTNGSGSRRPKNMWIRWIRIRIRNTDQNEGTNGPIPKLRIETKPKRFDVFQNLKWNVSIYSKNFGTKPKLFYVFPLFFAKAKTFLFIPKMLEQTQNFLMCSDFFFSKSKTLRFNPKILRSERERFGSIMNLVSKTNIFDFLGDVSRKTKANDL